MKVILTESQATYLLHEERLAQFLTEAFSKQKTMQDLKTMIKGALASGVAIAAILSAISRMSISPEQKDYLSNMAQKESTEMAFNHAERLKKIDACTKYMEYALKNQGFSLDSTGLKPETLVAKAEETGFDLPLLMAAAHQESCFGATSRARRTNSVFSVGSYDNGKDVVHYADPNDSVIGYINLLNNDYLTDGKTLSDLLVPGGFVNYNGHRYASDKNYEKKVNSIRNRIIRMFPELA